MEIRPWVGVAALGWLAALASPASATISRALSLDELVREADHVALVTCVDAQVSRDGRRRIVTDYTLQVQESMKGTSAAGATLMMRSLGGAIGDIGMRVEGEPHLSVGRRYLVFVRQLSDGRTLRPVGMSQGVMPVEDDRGALSVQPGGGGLALMERARGGQLTPAPPALLHPEPYPQVRDRIERAVGLRGEGAVEGRRGATAP